MNLEAISGIKRTSSICARVRKECLELIKPGIRLSLINDMAEKIISSNDAVSNFFDTENKWHIQIKINNQLSSKHYEFKDTDIASISISLNINSWNAKCSATKYLGQKYEIKELLQENKEAVTETCSSLCPGLPTNDIANALLLCHENAEPKAKHSCYSDLGPTLTIKNRLKTGDLLAIKCLSTYNDPKKENPQLTYAFHEETILITANGTETLTVI